MCGVVIATLLKSREVICMQQEHNTTTEDVEVMLYLLLHSWLFLRLGDHGVVFCAAIFLVVGFQKWWFGFVKETLS